MSVGGTKNTLVIGTSGPVAPSSTKRLREAVSALGNGGGSPSPTPAGVVAFNEQYGRGPVGVAGVGSVIARQQPIPRASIEPVVKFLEEFA